LADEIDELVDNLAPNSALEVSGNRAAVRALIARSDEVFFEHKNGKPFLVWGVTTRSFMDDTAVVWCLFTNSATANGFTFIRKSRIILKELARKHPQILCYVRVIFPDRWLLGIGFRRTRQLNDYWEYEYHGS
jgi:hypothetical protein